jgi:UPF0271 protein
LTFKVDINCDMGESYGAYKIGNDAELMPFITSANIACGFHAGDPVTIDRTMKLAKAHKVAVGAHPGFPDIMGFGRREMQLSPEETRDYLIYQIGAVQTFAAAEGIRLQHMKPHGALYNMAVKDEKLSKTLIDTIASLGKKLIIFAPPRSELSKRATKAGLKVACEFFADRAYNAEGNLISRAQAKSVLTDPRIITDRVVRAVTEKTVETINGDSLAIDEVNTICIHGDNPNAPALVRIVNKQLKKAAVKIMPAGMFL